MMNIGVFPRPLCSSPVLLVNRNAVTMLLHGAKLYEYEDTTYKKRNLVLTKRLRDLGEFPWKDYLRRGYAMLYHRCTGTPRDVKDGRLQPSDNYHVERVVNKYGLDHLARYVVILGDKYEFLYQCVACGHCQLCIDKKRNDFSARCAFESQTSPNRALFVTLTYSNENIPRWVDDHKRCRVRGIPIAEEYAKAKLRGMVSTAMYREMQVQRSLCSLSVDDAQKFLKRLRINWERKGLDISLFRYSIVGEYGSTSGHPHYHLILWGYPYPILKDEDPTSLGYLMRMTEDIKRAWGFGRVDCQIARNCARYVSKYIGKQDKHGRKGFRNSSNRGGGIGAKFIDYNRQFFYKNPSAQQISYVDKWSGQLSWSTLGQYATNRIFPPLRKYISPIVDLYQQTKQRLVELLHDAHMYIHDELYTSLETECLHYLNNLCPTTHRYSKLRPMERQHFQFKALYRYDMKYWSMSNEEIARELFNRLVQVLDKAKQVVEEMRLTQLMDKLSYAVQNVIECTTTFAESMNVSRETNEDLIAKLLNIREKHLTAMPVTELSDSYVYLRKQKAIRLAVLAQENEKL